MRASFRTSDDVDHVREMIASDLGTDDLGIKVHRRDNALMLSYPIAVVVGNNGYNAALSSILSLVMSSLQQLGNLK